MILHSSQSTISLLITAVGSDNGHERHVEVSQEVFDQKLEGNEGNEGMAIGHPAHKNHIEGLRGIASIMVLLSHWSSSTFIGAGPSGWLKTQVPFNFLFNSSWGLYVFFIVTGRVISLSFLKTSKHGTKKISALAKSVVKRPFRLFPITFISVLLQWFACRFGWLNSVGPVELEIFNSESGPVGWCRVGESIKDVFFYVFSLFAGNINPPVALLTSSSNWAIPVFYYNSNVIYLVSLVIVCVPRRSWVLMASLIIWNIFFESYTYVFLIGLSMAEAETRGVWEYLGKSLAIVRYSIAFCAVIFIGLGIWIPSSSYFFNGVLQNAGNTSMDWVTPAIPARLVDRLYIGNVMTAFAICFICEISENMQWLLKTSLFRWLGSVSIGLYLTHDFVIKVVNDPLIHLINKGNPDINYSLLVFISFLITFIFSFIFAYLATLLVTTPSVVFSEWIWTVFFETKWSFKNLDEGVFKLATEGPGLAANFLYRESGFKAIKNKIRGNRK